MTDVDVLAGIGAHRIVPVVVIDDPADAGSLGGALVAGGLPVAEVTLRTPAALAALRELAGLRPELLLGAGTVIAARQVTAAVAAGARFVVTPGFSAAVVAECRTLGVPLVPGVATPTEVLQALDAGLDVVKLFPASLSGGVPMIRALSGPFPHVRFVPTGGIEAEHLRDYLVLPQVLAVGGSWMATRTMVRGRDVVGITRRVSEALALLPARAGR